MKILHVISSLNPTYGGPVEGVIQVAIAAKNQGHDIEIAVTDPPGSPWLTDFGIRIHALGPRFLTYAYASRLVPWLREHAAEYDAVIIQGLWQYTGYATKKVLQKAGVPYFVFTHGQLGTWFKKAFPHKQFKKWAYWKLIEHDILHNAKAVFFTSEDERLQSRESFRPYDISEAVVGYGTVIPSGDSQQQRELFHSRYTELRDKRLFVCMGRIARQKACDLLIQAFAEVADTDPSLHLVMAGPDSEGWQHELNGLAAKLGIRERITWTGMLTGDLKWGAFHAAECFVLPSHHESFGVVVAEALSCGVPVLISDKVNIWHEVDAAGAGFVATDDLPGTVGSMKKWLALPEQDKSCMREKARACFFDNFDMSLSVRRMNEVITSFVVCER